MVVDPVRDAAVDVLFRVFERGRHIDVSLNKTLRRKNLGARGRRFLTQLAYGTVRHRVLCDHALQRICHDPLDKLPPHILIILRMAIFQSLFCDQVTRPAMVHTSVDLAKRRGHAGTARLVNAVLRRAPGTVEEAGLPERADGAVEYLALRYSVPEWMVRLWFEQFGEADAEAICEAQSEPAPVTLRVNACQGDPQRLAEQLGKSGIAAVKQTAIPEELTAESAGAVLRSKWFRDGRCMLQDTASMLPVHLLEPVAGERVLDLCAAPGGKTTHIAEYTGGGARVVAMDLVPFRLAGVIENAERLGLPGIRLVAGDGTAPPLRAGFDRVLVDAPCSGLGTLRRHPDLKWRMDAEALPRLAAVQGALLRSALTLCRPGGVVVYSVCTFTQQETVDVVDAVLGECSAQPDDGPELLDTWKIAKGQYRILPTKKGLDGFFLTRFLKAS